jgi:hypothetical protein
VNKNNKEFIFQKTLFQEWSLEKMVFESKRSEVDDLIGKKEFAKMEVAKRA